jgi:hypothetical protein
MLGKFKPALKMYNKNGYPFFLKKGLVIVYFSSVVIYFCLLVW